jgi:predicted ATP-dependent serine protease
MLTHSTDAEAASAWRMLEKKINDNLNKMDNCTKHLNDINSYTKLNLERASKTLSLRHGPIQHPEEHVTFPITMIQRTRNENFFGRQDELKNINEFLGQKATNLRTYTIYGRRGVGKTDIALEYAHENKADFEAIFWVNCETSVALRQSFTDMAVALNIPGADKNGWKPDFSRCTYANDRQVITKKISRMFSNGSKLPVGVSSRRFLSTMLTQVARTAVAVNF